MMHGLDAQALSRSLDSLLDDLEVVRWCRRQLALGHGPGRALQKTRALRCAHAARVLALIRRLDAPFSRELEATVVADAGGVGPSTNTEPRPTALFRPHERLRARGHRRS